MRSHSPLAIGSRRPSPSKASRSLSPNKISRSASPSSRGISPSQTRPVTPPSRWVSPSRIRTSNSPTSSQPNRLAYSVSNFLVDFRKGGKSASYLEDVHKLRLLHNRYLQWRYTNKQAEAVLSIHKVTAEVGFLYVTTLIFFTDVI